MRKLAILALIGATLAGTASADVVYDGITTQGNNGFNYYSPTADKIGDVFSLAGTARQLSELDLGLYAPNGYSGNLELSFYNWDDVSGTPGSVIDDETLTGVTLSKGFFGEIDITGLAPISLPDTVLVGWQFNNYVTNNDPGLLFGWNPSIGSSANFFWDFTNNGAYYFGGGDNTNLTANFAARLSAVTPAPEPLPWLTLGGGVALLGLKRRRR